MSRGYQPKTNPEGPPPRGGSGSAICSVCDPDWDRSDGDWVCYGCAPGPEPYHPTRLEYFTAAALGSACTAEEAVRLAREVCVELDK